jgi:hypothetical protein
MRAATLHQDFTQRSLSAGSIPDAFELAFAVAEWSTTGHSSFSHRSQPDTEQARRRIGRREEGTWWPTICPRALAVYPAGR